MDGGQNYDWNNKFRNRYDDDFQCDRITARSQPIDIYSYTISLSIAEGRIICLFASYDFYLAPQ